MLDADTGDSNIHCWALVPRMMPRKNKQNANAKKGQVNTQTPKGQKMSDTQCKIGT
jgi:hypothetical protein